MKKFLKLFKLTLPLLTFSMAIVLTSIPVQAQDAGFGTAAGSIIPSIINQIISQPQNSYSAGMPLNPQQMVQQFLMEHPNFQQQHPNEYNQMINNPNAFMNMQNYNNWHQQNWQSWQNQYPVQQTYQQFLQTHPEFAQLHPQQALYFQNHPEEANNYVRGLRPENMDNHFDHHGIHRSNANYARY